MNADCVSLIHAEWHCDPCAVPLKTGQELSELWLVLGMCPAESCFDFEEASLQSGKEEGLRSCDEQSREPKIISESEIIIYEITTYGIKACTINL